MSSRTLEPALAGYKVDPPDDRASWNRPLGVPMIGVRT